MSLTVSHSLPTITSLVNTLSYNSTCSQVSSDVALSSNNTCFSSSTCETVTCYMSSNTGSYPQMTFTRINSCQSPNTVQVAFLGWTNTFGSNGAAALSGWSRNGISYAISDSNMTAYSSSYGLLTFRLGYRSTDFSGTKSGTAWVTLMTPNCSSNPGGNTQDNAGVSRVVAPIVGGAGGFFFLLIVAACCVFCCRRRARRRIQAMALVPSQQQPKPVAGTPIHPVPGSQAYTASPIYGGGSIPYMAGPAGSFSPVYPQQPPPVYLSQEIQMQHHTPCYSHGNGLVQGQYQVPMQYQPGQQQISMYPPFVPGPQGSHGSSLAVNGIQPSAPLLPSLPIDQPYQQQMNQQQMNQQPMNQQPMNQQQNPYYNQPRY
ncbi:hypothetical protein BASA61_001139 [Batrachochytrium salamandrivorans]|nr:hypothetical protein BASA61_001139 [Batrachochytrium salamandrivorans]